MAELLLTAGRWRLGSDWPSPSPSPLSLQEGSMACSWKEASEQAASGDWAALCDQKLSQRGSRGHCCHADR